MIPFLKGVVDRLPEKAQHSDHQEGRNARQQQQLGYSRSEQQNRDADAKQQQQGCLATIAPGQPPGCRGCWALRPRRGCQRAGSGIAGQAAGPRRQGLVTACGCLLKLISMDHDVNCGMPIELGQKAPPGRQGCKESLPLAVDVRKRTLNIGEVVHVACKRTLLACYRSKQPLCSRINIRPHSVAPLLSM